MGKEILENILNDNLKNKIANSENKVIKNILGHDVTMKEIFEYLDGELTMPQQESFWLSVLSVSTHQTTDQLKELREEGQKKLKAKIVNVKTSALKLRDALSEMHQLLENNCLRIENSSDNQFSLIDLFDHAVSQSTADKQYRYENNVKNDLHRFLGGQYDSRYYPTLAEIINAIADIADNSKAEYDYDTQRLQKRTISDATFTRKIFGRINDYTKNGDKNNMLPESFRLPSKLMAELLTIILYPEGDHFIDAKYVDNIHLRIKKDFVE